MKWISVKDSSPREDQIVLVWSDGYGCVRRHYGDGRFNYEHITSYDKDVTHWMPMPEPPK